MVRRKRVNPPLFKSSWPQQASRRPRVFFSHRWADDRSLYDDVLRELNQLRFPVQDVSVPEDHKLTGVRGGKVAEHVLRRDIAARIFTADLLIAPSGVGVSNSDWVCWEVETAALCFSVPVLFVRHKRQTYNTALVRGLRAAGAQIKLCHDDPLAVRFAIQQMLFIPIQTGVQIDRLDIQTEYRGPNVNALDAALAEHPYQRSL